MKYDTSYYEIFNNKLILVPAFSKKTNGFVLNAPDAPFRIKYFTNTPPGIGFNFSYDYVSFSLSIGSGIFDKSHDEKGKTKSLNFATTVNARKFLIDFYLQQYKGLYMGDNKKPDYTTDPYYLRPDIKTQLFGVNAKYLVNNRKFSLKAPFVSNAWQKKSAGSLLLGAEILYGRVKGDSAFVPQYVSADFPNNDVFKFNYLMFGPAAGYAYTLVIKKHFFVTGIAAANTDVARITEEKSGKGSSSYWRFEPTVDARAAVGYNSRDWQASASYMTRRIFLNGENKDATYQLYTDNFRVSVIRRLNPGKLIPSITDWGKRIINDLGLGFLVN